MEAGYPVIEVDGEPVGRYDLVIGAVGVNSSGLRLFENLGFGFRPPKTTKTSIVEIHLDREKVQEFLGTSMHVFLLNIPGLKFAALIPKPAPCGSCNSMFAVTWCGRPQRIFSRPVLVTWASDSSPLMNILMPAPS